MGELPVDEEIYCEICGRKLRTPESRRRRRGPACDEKVNPGTPKATRGRDHSPRTTSTDAPHGPDLLDELAAGGPVEGGER